MKAQCFPGYFSQDVAADRRRAEFDCKNEVLLQHGTKISCVFFGDSITQRWELGAYFSFDDGCIINRGIGGDDTTYGAKRFYADVVQLHPNRCVSLIGINDAWDLENDPWKRQNGMKLENVLERAVQNHEQMLQMAKDAKIDMYLCSLLPCEMPFTGADKERRQYIAKLNKELRRLCEKWDATYVNYYDSMVQPDSDCVKPELVVEGLHPNSAGYDEMTRILLMQLRAG